jgi:hypothetical protein
MDGKIDETENYESAQSRGFQDGYKDGLEMAWAIAKRIIKSDKWKMDNLFDVLHWIDIFENFTASEAIQKLKEYDYQKACEEAKAARQKIIIEDLKEMYRKYSPDEVFAAQKEIDLDGR